MSDKDSNEIGKYQHVSYYLPQWDEKGKCHWKGIGLQHKSLNAEAKCVVPPTKAIPVIFIPGIMGTNLKNNMDDQPIWRADWVQGADTLPFVGLNGKKDASY